MFRFSLSPVKPVRAYFVLIVASMALGYFLWKPIYIDASNAALLTFSENSKKETAILNPNDFAYDWLQKAFSELKSGKNCEHAAQLKDVLGIKDNKVLIDAYLNYPNNCASVNSSSLVQIVGTMLDVSKARMPEMKVIFQLTVVRENGAFRLEHLDVNSIGQEKQLHDFVGGLSRTGPQHVIARNKWSLKLARISHAWSDFDTKRSHQEMKRAIESNPECSYFYYFDGTSYLQEGDNLSALSNFNKCLQLDPNNSYALVNRANAKENLKDFAGSVYDTNEALRINPNNFYAHLNQGCDHYTYSNYVEAINSYNTALKLDPTNLIALNMRAKCFEALNEKDYALADYRLISDFYPDDYTAYLKRGILLADMHQLHNAVQTLENANFLCPMDLEHKKDLMLIYEKLSYNYSRIKLEAMAFVYAEKEIKLDPKDENGYVDRALSYWKWNQIDKALVDVEKAVAVKPNRILTYNILAKLKLEKHDLKGALEACDETLRRSVGVDVKEIVVDTLELRAKIKKQLGDFEGSKKDLEEASNPYLHI